MQVPPHEMAEFRRFLAKLGYVYWDESRNPAYKLFLG
jgi:threonine dehydratase